ncbi:MAG: VOC family protein [Gemmatimonadota bacterium]
MSRVVHFEVHVEDPARAIAFYSTIFGWQFTKWEGPQDYWLIKTGAPSEPGIDGAMLRRRGPIDGQAVIAYVCTIESKSVDESLRQILAHGGQLALAKMAIPAVGWLAYAKDPEGNLFGVMQPDPTAA